MSQPLKNLLFALVLMMTSHAYAAELELFPNYQFPEAESNRKFKEQVHERFDFDSTMLRMYIQRTKGEIVISSPAEAECVYKLGGTAALIGDLMESKKYDQELNTFFVSSDGPRKARVFSGIMLGEHKENERPDLLSLPSNSTMMNALVASNLTSLMIGQDQSAFKRVAAMFHASHCKR